MKKLHANFLSQTRQKVLIKADALRELYLHRCSGELLFHGRAAKVYRKCGKPNCHCVEGGDRRHGPYQIIHVFRDGKNTQVTLTEDEMHFIKMANRYQEEALRRKQIIALQRELMSMLDDLLERRTIWDKEEYQRQE